MPGRWRACDGQRASRETVAGHVKKESAAWLDCRHLGANRKCYLKPRAEDGLASWSFTFLLKENLPYPPLL